MNRTSKPLIACLCCGLLAASLGVARADETQLARADALFVQGKGRFSRGDYDGACRDFAESVQLDPATGSLLALAMCHERDGKFATASREYEQVVVRSEAEGRTDRARAARARSAVLAPKLSTVTIRLSDAEAPKGLTLVVDGRVLSSDELSAPIAVDGGSVTIEATAHGMKAFSKNLTVATSQDHQTLTIPEFAAMRVELPFVRPAVFFASAPRAAARVEARGPWLNEVRWFGIGTAGVGVIGFAAASALAVHAHDVEQQEAWCEQDACDGEGPRSPFAARDARRASTLSFVGAGAALATGLTLLLWGGRKAHGQPSERQVALSPWATRSDGGAVLHTSF